MFKSNQLKYLSCHLVQLKILIDWTFKEAGWQSWLNIVLYSVCIGWTLFYPMMPWELSNGPIQKLIK